MAKRCYLRCILNSHPPLDLPNNTEVKIGRSKLTKITDRSCSRHQLSFKAILSEHLVELKQIGINPSGIDGFAMVKNSVYKVGHGTRVHILLNNNIHIIEFDPPPSHLNDTPRTNTKRKLEEEEIEQKNKKSKLEHEIAMDSDKFFEATENTWESVDNGQLYVFTAKGVKSSFKIAAFDMDSTLIQTKSGKVLPVDTDDWQIIFPSVSKKLQETFNDGYKVVILTNQLPIGNGKVKIEDFKKKIESIVDTLKVPIQAFIATGKGFYRKPTPGMWNYLCEKKNNNVTVDMETSFYCGDAAGRADKWAPGKKKDHSMADKLMAENLNLTFYTPEEFFLGHSIANVPMMKPEFHPKDVKEESFNDKLISNEKEVLVLVGFPGSGKSFLAKQIERKSNYKYASVCRDKLGSWQKCATEAKKILQQNKSVIVDSTNPDLESRARWTSLAREAGVAVRCVAMTTTFAHARHNNKFRELMKMSHAPVSDIVFHTYKNKFVEPSTKEGFKEVIKAKFNPSFEDIASEKIYRMHLLEK